MTAISALNNAHYLNAPPPSAGAPAAGKAGAKDGGAQSSTIVSIGAADTANTAQTYYFPNTPAASAVPPIWQHAPGDAVSMVMAGNYLQPSLADRFKGLGGALLNSFKDGGGNFSQSVMQGMPAQSADQAGAAGAAEAATPGAQVFSTTMADEKLNIQTKSGVKVELSLENQGNGLTVKASSSGDLSDAERAAVAQLSGAFQDALDGLGAATPSLDLSGLTQFDSSVLSSVDLHSEVTPQGQATQTIDFHADSQARTVNVQGPAGALKVNVDMRNAASWGSDTQRADAMNNYLKQFDAAATRGQGDQSLVAMFKDAFSEMNSSLAQPSTLLRPSAMPLTDSDHAMLSGLADFDASVTQAAKAGNPMHLNELDTFSYSASQSTTVRGDSILDRSISQQQHAQLNASYHEGLVPDIPLELSTLKSSQNYYFKQIDDSADSAVGINYFKGGLTKALLTQAASQSMHASKYEMGELVEDMTTPLKGSRTTDILGTLKPFLKNGKLDTQADRYQWQDALAKVHDSILLQSDPLSLRGDAAQ
ncbi:MAG TPA: hypothetical protein VGN04_15245 [Herbaspirillum sp.]|jgi:hypothetical protein